MYQQVEPIKKTLESTLIEIIEAIKTNSGPIAERLLYEYSFRNYLGGIFCFVIAGVLGFFTFKLIKRIMLNLTNVEPIPECLLSGFMILALVFIIPIGCSYVLDAISPLYSLIKSIR